jgi:hypothetical protein
MSMASNRIQQEPKTPVEYYKDSGATNRVDRASSSTSSNNNDVAVKQQVMTKAVWLACIGLGLAYTTAFQQNACTTAIVKHIDDELGICF